MKKLFSALSCIFFSVSVFANDVANFNNLGFSDDSRWFLFAESGQNPEKNEIFANGYLVDVAANRFAKNGTKSISCTGSVQAGYADTGILFNLISEWNTFLKPFSINHINTGRLVYSLEPGAEAKNILSYRDFFTKKSYDIELNQMKTSHPLSSSFFISVKITDADGKQTAKMIGLSDFQRPNVDSYFIRQVIVSPNGNYIVFVIAKKMIVNGETSIRYMVETLTL